MQKNKQQSISMPDALYEKAQLLALLTGRKSVSRLMREAVEFYIEKIESDLEPVQKRMFRELRPDLFN
jgi:predicted DNA-binding protein